MAKAFHAPATNENQKITAQLKLVLYCIAKPHVGGLHFRLPFLHFSIQVPHRLWLFGLPVLAVELLASLGAKLIISARNEVELNRVRTQLKGKHAPDEVKILPLDLSSGEDSLWIAVEKAESFFPDSGVDYMIHNAAFERPGMCVCLFRWFYEFRNISSAEIPTSKKTSILDVTEEGLKMSSAAAKAPAPGQAVYSASKYAVNGYFHTLRSELCQKGIQVTVICPGPIATSNNAGSRVPSEKRVPSERCAELTIIAVTHGLKEAWISYQPVLTVMYLVQYMPTIGYWVMDKIGKSRVEAAEQKGNTYSLSLMLGKKKAT
ncbi:hypothetical protein JHK86_026243 [Glycine max]|nr:hypothetical protein JHK86_026243 [Glycine max]